MVDVEGFGAADRTTPDRVAMRRGLLDAVKTAFREAGVRWRGVRVEDGGDELLVVQHREQARMRLRAGGPRDPAVVTAAVGPGPIELNPSFAR